MTLLKYIAGTLGFLFMIFGIGALCTCAAWAADGAMPTDKGELAWIATCAVAILGIVAVVLRSTDKAHSETVFGESEDETRCGDVEYREFGQ